MKGRRRAEGTLIYSRESLLPAATQASATRRTRKDLWRLLPQPCGRQWGELRKVTFTFRSRGMGQSSLVSIHDAQKREGRRERYQPDPCPGLPTWSLLGGLFTLSLTPFTRTT